MPFRWPSVAVAHRSGLAWLLPVWGFLERLQSLQSLRPVNLFMRPNLLSCRSTSGVWWRLPSGVPPDLLYTPRVEVPRMRSLAPLQHGTRSWRSETTFPMRASAAALGDPLLVSFRLEQETKSMNTASDFCTIPGKIWGNLWAPGLYTRGTKYEVVRSR